MNHTKTTAEDVEADIERYDLHMARAEKSADEARLILHNNGNTDRGRALVELAQTQANLAVLCLGRGEVVEAARKRAEEAQTRQRGGAL